MSYSHLLWVLKWNQRPILDLQPCLQVPQVKRIVDEHVLLLALLLTHLSLIAAIHELSRSFRPRWQRCHHQVLSDAESSQVLWSTLQDWRLPWESVFVMFSWSANKTSSSLQFSIRLPSVFYCQTYGPHHLSCIHYKSFNAHDHTPEIPGITTCVKCGGKCLIPNN